MSHRSELPTGVGRRSKLRRQARLRNEKLKLAKAEDAAVVEDVVNRLHGRPVLPRCPHCHQPLEIVYTACRVWNSGDSAPLGDPDGWSVLHTGSWCGKCHCNVSDVLGEKFPDELG